jgi:hypothetical protein
MGRSPSLFDLFKGTDLRRTIITCLMYASQNFAGNLIANQATFFFERECPVPSFGRINFQAWMTDSRRRGWRFAQLCLQAQPDQFVSSIRRKRVLLVPDRLVRSSNHLSLGHCHQHRFPFYPRHHCLDPAEQVDQLRPGRSWYHHLLRFRRYPRADLLFHHCRDILRPSSRFEYRRGSCCILRRRDPHDLPGLTAAQPYRMGSRR